MDKKETLKTLIHNANYIVIMTGAGFSVPSGIPDFRSSGGLYNDGDYYDYSPEEILSHSFFIRYPEVFYQFYRDKMIYRDAFPNIAHMTVAKLEEIGKVKAVITQNIDGLHQLAGNKNVIELHGSIHRNYCMECGSFYGLDKILDNESLPKCECGGLIKPDVVLYEEPLHESTIEKALWELRKADLLIVAGTSLLVNPAASLIYYFQGNHFVIINKANTPFDNKAQLVINEGLENILTSDILMGRG